MPEHNPMLAMLLESNSFVGMAPDVENEIMPIDAQLNFGPGDVAMLAGANTPLESDFAIVQAIDPEQKAETYPDWEERLLNSYVLCSKFSKNDPEVSIGWFSRVKILPISHQHYEEALGWLVNGFPDEVPSWCETYHHRYVDQLAQHAPEIVPRGVVCPYCESRDVALIVQRRLEYTSKAGTVLHDGKNLFVPINQVEESSTHTATLRCKNCKAYADLGDEEWNLPGISN